MTQKQRSKKTSMLLYYPIVAGVLALCVLIFALCYSGGGAQRLRGDEPGDAAPQQETPDSAEKPVPVATLEPVKRTGRLLPYKENGKWGYKNTKGQMVIGAQYAAAQEFEGNIAFAAMDGSGLYGLIDRYGNWLTSAIWSSVRPFSGGWAAVEQNGYWGYIDETGKYMVEPQFREAGEYTCGRARVRTGSFWGYIDADGDLVIEAEWKTCFDFAEDVAFAQSTSGRWYMIDKAGTRVATLGTNLSGETYSEGYAAVCNNGEYFYYNNKGRSAYSKTFEDARAFSGGYAAVKSGGLWGFINTRGAWAVEAQYKAAESFSNGLAAVQDPESLLWGYINSSGELKIEYRFDTAGAFSDDVAVVSMGTEVLLLDKEGNTTSLYWQ